ncbi:MULTISPECIES: type II secretion system F family protein [Brenneria]|uniref:Pilus assembly protein n=1 Tax=Brenneria nigrifluens DSM 30175 = ATCC 13028 TaxID=1121120 RepID=A0A2U1URP9_9GAMM|nr:MULTISPECIES: type II secretion system F family protein [Brenneria]EHD23069.1 Type II secretion system F domain [Brenneria sp. EniD312]PWC24358.1 pilus assembly protein [Brenneria nigrifluens] [Brenneria nigrifluens DSM 30175 = ATCC 13028]QCR05956.1 pilus assembly protein [Brenneria nigrifluens] [Brenneria nigrifluens DSM 30175 = ATCC 13028]
MTDLRLNLITLLVFCCVLLLCFACYAWQKARQRRARREQRWQRILAEVEPRPAQPLSGSILRDEIKTPLMNVPLLGRWLAGIWSQLAFIGWKKNLRQRALILAALCLTLGMILGQRTLLPLTLGLVFALLLFIAIGTLLFRSALQKHLKALRESLPEAIDAITRSCRAGVPVANTFAIVAEHLTGPLANEFKTIDHWLKLGIPLRQVIQTSAGRVPMAEYRFFVVILIINQEAGGRLGETLERLSATLRARRELQLKVQSKTSEARASAKIVAALFPCCLAYLYMRSPDDFSFLFSDPVGTTVLIYALCSVTLGMLVTHFMVKRIS